VLAESRQDQNTALLPCVQEIVNACLGTRYTMADIDRIQTVFNNIATNLNPNQMNIDIRCSDPQVMYQNNRVYPVSIRRLGGTAQAQFIYIPIRVVEMVTLAETFNFATTDHLNWQEQVIGSRTVWCDILLFEILQPQAGTGFLLTVSGTRLSGWSFSTLNRPINQPNSQPYQFSLLNFKTATLVMMHELLHSCAAGVDLAYPGHTTSTQTGRPINDLNDVLNYAQYGGYQGVPLTSNPSSLAYLAFLLNMPWYKWWDKNPQTGLVQIDGLVRWNNDPDSAGFKLPPFMKNLGTPDVVNEQMARGPFDFT